MYTPKRTCTRFMLHTDALDKQCSRPSKQNLTLSVFARVGWIRALRYSPNGLLIACGMGGETAGAGGGVSIGGSKRHSPREEDGTIKIVSGERPSAQSPGIPFQLSQVFVGYLFLYIL